MIVFRVDSSTQIGSGHLMRCLTLAGHLKKERNVEILFVSRNLEGNLNCLILQQGYKLYALPRKKIDATLEGYEKWLTVKQTVDAKQTQEVLRKSIVEYLIVDSYAIDETWEKIIRPYVKNIMVIDDLANRKHDCDSLLDQNYYSDMKTRYDGLVSNECKMLLGPQYALLREEFYEVRKKMRVRDGNIKNILIFFGGSDVTNETMKALKAVELLDRKDIKVNVVVGHSNNHKGSIESFCIKKETMQFYCQVNNMAELMNEADLAIGAGGTTTWERCFLGLPTIVIAIAENQVKICEDCTKIEYIKYLGECKNIESKNIYDALKSMIENHGEYQTIEMQLKKYMNQNYWLREILL